MTAFKRTPVWKDIGVPEMRQMRESGMTNKEIALACGCSTTTVKNYLGPKYGKRKTSVRRIVTESMVDEAEKLRKDGLTWVAIAEKLGCGAETIRYWFTKRHNPAAKAQKPETTGTVPTLQERLEMEIAEGKRLPPPGYAGQPKPEAAETPAESGLIIRGHSIVLEGSAGIYNLDFIAGTVKFEPLYCSDGMPINADSLQVLIEELQELHGMLKRGRMEGGALIND